MVVGVCGFISTGSSAVSDFLKEFDETSVVDKAEFVLPYFPDGLEDLDFHLNIACSKYMSSAVAIERFRRFFCNFFVKRRISKEKKAQLMEALDTFLDDIVQVRWKGYGKSDYQLVVGRHYSVRFSLLWTRFVREVLIAKLEKISSKDMDSFERHLIEYSIRPEGFSDKARAFVNKVLEIYGADLNKIVVLDQPFNGNDPVRSFGYFDNPKAVVVDRDPRDQYVFAKRFLRRKGRQIPTDSVEDFIEFYKRMREGQPYKLVNNDVLCLHFEDMIYRYDETTDKVADFCGLDKSKRVRTIFAPEMSINNTQVYKRYPEYQEDIELIEKELKDYLYPFEEFGEREITGKMFYGKSPLNK